MKQSTLLLLVVLFCLAELLTGIICKATKTSANGQEFVKKHEGLKLNAYLDPGKKKDGKPITIGYGHTGGVKLGDKITEKQANNLLAQDLKKADKAITRKVTVPLNQNQFDALSSFTFNVGRSNFANSTLLKKLNNKDYAGAANQFPNWVYSNKTKVEGLVNRRKDEQNLFLKKP